MSIVKKPAWSGSGGRRQAAARERRQGHSGDWPRRTGSGAIVRSEVGEYVSTIVAEQRVSSAASIQASAGAITYLCAEPHAAASLLSEWLRRETRYRANSYRGTGAPDELFVEVGTRAVLLTACHSVAQVRRGARKKPDLRTGGLAELVATAAGASALTALGSGSGDPNWDAEHVFKRRLRELADGHRFVLDLHGMQDHEEIDVCLGSGIEGARNAALVDACRTSATEAGLRVSVDHPYAGKRETTITSTAQRLGCSAVQIEIAVRCRDPRRQPEKSFQLARWLIDLARSLTD